MKSLQGKTNFDILSMTDKKLSRRKWIKLSVQLLSAPLLLLWYKATERRMAFGGHRKIYLPGDLPEGITFLGDIVLTRNAGRVRAFSARCTHLGCTITHRQDGNMICPCHGSKFTQDGAVLNGPANRPLTPLKIHTDSTNRRRFVEI